MRYAWELSGSVLTTDGRKFGGTLKVEAEPDGLEEAITEGLDEIEDSELGKRLDGLKPDDLQEATFTCTRVGPAKRRRPRKAA